LKINPVSAVENESIFVKAFEFIEGMLTAEFDDAA